MMWLLTSANDAILVILTFMLQLEFDSNLLRYNLHLWGVGVNDKYFVTALDRKEYQMYIKCWFGSLTDFILLVLIFLPFGGMCILLFLFRLSNEFV